MPKLFWFHAFDRRQVTEVFEVLRNGPTHHPDPNADTRKHEERLGISPPRVYAYLGRTLEQFGSNALVLSERGATGEMSPFDTGGLINKIEPVASLDDAKKKEYLAAFTWKSSNRTALLAKYPANSVKDYLDGANPPPHDGPHCIWTSKQVETIWTQNNDWRAWTWEIRANPGFNVSHLVRWTCSPSMYPLLLDQAIQFAKKSSNRDWVSELLTRYVNGGVSTLVHQLKTEQAA